MKNYIVGHIDFGDNDLILEEIAAESPHDALWQHSSLQGDVWDGCREDTMGLIAEEIQDWSFDFDMVVCILEVKGLEITPEIAQVINDVDGFIGSEGQSPDGDRGEAWDQLVKAVEETLGHKSSWRKFLDGEEE